MSYIIRTRHADGSRSEKRVKVEGDPARAERRMVDGMKARRKALRDRKGWARGHDHQLLGSVPKALWEYIHKNHGAEAAKDWKFVQRKCLDMGYDVRAGR